MYIAQSTPKEVSWVVEKEYALKPTLSVRYVKTRVPFVLESASVDSQCAGKPPVEEDEHEHDSG